MANNWNNYIYIYLVGGLEHVLLVEVLIQSDEYFSGG